MSLMMVLALVALLLMIIVKFLNLQSSPAKPRLVFSDSKFAESIVKHCPLIAQEYRPTRLWGLSGHVQSVVHALLGRVYTRSRQSVRRCHRLSDGATLTWDEWTALECHPQNEDFTLAVCPGLCNSSESVYIWSFVHYATTHGYRCIVLNHLGALRSVKLTAPRIFGYGRTEELDVMLREHMKLYPATRVVLVGFSMGGNIVTKYMGQPAVTRVSSILAAISICQGYDASCCVQSMQYWSQLRRLYMLILTENMKKIILRHRSTLLSDSVRSKFQLDERQICMASSLSELDEAYTRRVNGYSSVAEFYRDNSCCHSICHIDTPMVFINSLDDPLVPHQALSSVTQNCANHSGMLLIETAHGGHLGFYQGGFFVPDPVTWLDRTVVQLSHALVATITASAVDVS